MSNEPSSRRDLVRLRLDKVQAAASRKIYSEHGVRAVRRPRFGQVCQRLMVESYCTPGSAQAHAASAIWRQRSFELWVSTTSPVVRAMVSQGLSAIAAFMKASDTRIELFEFCPLTVW